MSLMMSSGTDDVIGYGVVHILVVMVSVVMYSILVMMSLMLHCHDVINGVIDVLCTVWHTHTTGVTDSPLRILQGGHYSWIPSSD